MLFLVVASPAAVLHIADTGGRPKVVRLIKEVTEQTKKKEVSHGGCDVRSRSSRGVISALTGGHTVVIITKYGV